MFYVAIESVKNAEKKGGLLKAYLAQLVPTTSGGVDRRFARKEAALNKGNRRAFRMDAKPGQVFEARRWWWDGERYIGGVVWFGIQADGSIWSMSRDEAMGSVTMARLVDQTEPSQLVEVERLTRVPPERVFCLPKQAEHHAIDAATTAAAATIIDA